MTISVIKPRGYEINVIYVGSHYYFHSSYCGVVAIAERKGYKTEEEVHTFTLKAGNRHLVGGSLGGSVMFSVVEKFIRKEESKFVEHVTNFEREEFDGADCTLNISASYYRG
jgi:hypothetical protein